MIAITLEAGTDLLPRKFFVIQQARGNNVLISYFSVCNRRNSMTVNDNTIQAEGLRDFFRNLGKKGLHVSKKTEENVIQNQGGALDITAKIATAAVSKTSKQALSTLPDLLTFFNTGKGLHLGKFVTFKPSK